LAARYLWYSGVPGCGPGECSSEDAAPIKLLDDGGKQDEVTDGRDTAAELTVGGGRPADEAEGVDMRTVAIGPGSEEDTTPELPLTRGNGLLEVRMSCGVGGNALDSGGPKSTLFAVIDDDPCGTTAERLTTAGGGTEEEERLETGSLSPSSLLLLLRLSSPSSEMSE
jgi:hypothetical protein